MKDEDPVAACMIASIAVHWTDAIDPGTPVREIHLTELRGNLNSARTFLGIPQVSFTDVPITAGATIIKAVHLLEIRAATQ